MQLNLMLSRIEDIANVEQRPEMEQRTMALVVAPKPIVFQRLASSRVERERREAQAAEAEEQENASVENEADHDDDDEEAEGEGEVENQEA
jgi:translation initiation factor IF-3